LKTNIIQTSAFYIVQLWIFDLVNLQYNVPLMRSPSVIAGPLVY